MRQRFERNTHKHIQRRLVIFWLLCSVIFFIVLVSFYSIQLYEKKKTFVSPISKQNPEQQTENVNKLIELLKEKHILFLTVFPYEETSYLIKLSSGEEVLFSGNKSLVEQVSSLQLVLSRLTIEGKHILHIDFRFDKPVLTMQ